MNVDINMKINFQNFKKELPGQLVPFLDRRDGAAQLVQELPRQFSLQNISPPAGKPTTREQRLWELTGLYYLTQQQFPHPYEALPIFSALYDQILLGQSNTGKRSHKGMPLLWMSECYHHMGFHALAKRYLMLTHCEDAIISRGIVDPDRSGTYFRLVWIFGMLDSEVRRYSAEIFKLSELQSVQVFYPEWTLQQLDQAWKTEIPALQEASIYVTNSQYINHLITQLGDGSGKSMEQLAEYLLSCIPGCRTTRRKRGATTEYDIVCSVDGLDVDFLSEFGRYFVCECKDRRDPADFSTIAKFCRVLDSTKSKFGILFSKNGISGSGRMLYAERERIKIYQDRGISIVVIDLNDLKAIADGTSLLSVLRAKYEALRLDLLDTSKPNGNSS